MSSEKSMTASRSCWSSMSSLVIFSVEESARFKFSECSVGGGGGGSSGEAAAAISGSLELSVETLFFCSFCFCSFSTIFGVVIGEVFLASGHVRLLCPVLWQILHLRDIVAFSFLDLREEWPKK